MLHVEQIVRTTSIAERPIPVNQCAVARARARGLCAALATLFAILLGRGAAAHPEFNPLETNRYAKFTILDGRSVRLAYTVLYGAAPAAEILKQADANSDGRIDPDEKLALGQKVQAAVRAGLSLAVDGRPAILVFEAPMVGLASDVVAPSPFSIDLVARFAADDSASKHVVRFDDATPLAALGETEVRVEEAPGARLLAAYRGWAPRAGERETRFVFRGPKFSALEDRSVSFRFGRPGKAPVQRTSRRVPIGLGVALFGALVGLGFLWWTRIRRR